MVEIDQNGDGRRDERLRRDWNATERERFVVAMRASDAREMEEDVSGGGVRSVSRLRD